MDTLRFERDEVTYHGTVLNGDSSGEYKELSTFREEYMNKLISEAKKYMPPEELILDLMILGTVHNCSPASDDIKVNSC